MGGLNDILGQRVKEMGHFYVEVKCKVMRNIDGLGQAANMELRCRKQCCSLG